MFDTILGLPVHALVVHAVVVLVPLAAVGLIAVAVHPPWRRPYLPVVALLATAGLAMVPVATMSGQKLEERIERRRRHRPADPGPRADGQAGHLPDPGHVAARPGAARTWTGGSTGRADDGASPCSPWSLRRGGRRQVRHGRSIAGLGCTVVDEPSGSARIGSPDVSGSSSSVVRGCAAAGAARPAGPGRCARPRPRRPARTPARRGCTTAGSRRCRPPGRGRRG